MKSFIQVIKKKIEKNIKINKIEIIDNSEKHKGHKFFNSKKLHLKLIIESEELRSLGRIQAHKKIMQILNHELKNNIHALEIKIN